MRGVDLRRWKFDWDLTFTAVAAHADGTIFHRYGGRDHRGADHWLGEASMAAFLGAGLQAHGKHVPVAGTGEYEPLPLDSVPAFAKRDRGECIHCHSVNPALRIEAQEAGTWSLDELWTNPAPDRIGIDLDVADQQVVTHVMEGSPSAEAGLKVGHRILRVGDVEVATASDMMFALDQLPFDATAVQVLAARANGPARTFDLVLPKNWKAATPRQFAWRPSKWGLAPAPGFGGPVFDAKSLKEAGLPEGTFAFRVQYLVTWGENQRWGKAAARAGIREGMTVLGTKDMRDFESIDHFHAWWRLTVKPNSEVAVVTWKDGRELELVVAVGE